jgi:hypothetical protein
VPILLAALVLAASPPAQLARKTLAEQLGVAEEAVRVQSVTPAEWPDASLGCPRKGMQYPQVITRGHQVALEAGGRSYSVHVAGGEAVVCGAPRKSGSEHVAAAGRLSELARRDLAARLKTAVENVKTVSLRPQTWPDAGLGCPQPGRSYAQLETRGFLIELEAGGRTYPYHSDMQRVVPCDK